MENNFRVKSVTPILRIFDEQKAKDFYLNFLEFSLVWEHRYEEDLPLYMQVSLGDCVLHLSEHYGDSSPGIAIRIEVENISNLHANLISKNYKYARPGFDKRNLEVCITDPFGNKLFFYEEKSK
ncbi:VOC family protein [Rhodococcus qingshengii]|nr:VOC family protein [Rhodococcus qingshengii]